MGPSQAGFELDTLNQVAVFPHGPDAIPPGGAGGETIIGAVLRGLGVEQAGADAVVCQLPHAESGTAAVAQAVATHAAHMGHAYFSDNSDPVRPHDLIEEVGGRNLCLGQLLALIALERGTVGNRDVAGGQYRRCARIPECRGDKIDRVDLDRHVRAIADFACQCGAGGQARAEAQAVELDVFRVVCEILRGAQPVGLGQGLAVRAAHNGITDCRIVDAQVRAELPCECQVRHVGTADAADVRHAAVVVHEVSRELAVQRRSEPTQRGAPLAAVAGVIVASTWNADAFAGQVNAKGG
ncbi:hypothetical protein D9M70_500380 [compost metagenome]